MSLENFRYGTSGSQSQWLSLWYGDPESQNTTTWDVGTRTLAEIKAEMLWCFVKCSFVTFRATVMWRGDRIYNEEQHGSFFRREIHQFLSSPSASRPGV